MDKETYLSDLETEFSQGIMLDVNMTQSQLDSNKPGPVVDTSNIYRFLDFLILKRGGYLTVNQFNLVQVTKCCNHGIIKNTVNV